MPKNPTAWNANPNATTNLWTYDQAGVTYDETGFTYDGVVTGQSFIEPRISTEYTTVTKNTTAWSEA